MLQPFYDIVKLLNKEVIVPSENRFVFLSAPLFGMASVIIVSTMLWKTIINPSATFVGDMIVVVYLLTIPAISAIMGGFASKNPLSSLGASREMKLALSYELPFVMALVVPIIKCGSVKLGDIVTFQIIHGTILHSPSGIIACAIALLCTQAKLGVAPFDVADAETEISSGIFMEYSGAPLAVFRLTKYMLFFTVPMFLVTIFMGGIYSLVGILKYVVLLVLVILIKNTNPRVRIDQAVKFFWGPMSILGILAIILALFGL
jgi:NADH-quinone oxidoreductase subunit H